MAVVGSECHAVDRMVVAAEQHGPGLRRSPVENAHEPVLACGSHMAVVGSERQVCHALMASANDHRRDGGGVPVPDANAAVACRSGHMATVGGERQAREKRDINLIWAQSS